LGEEEDEKEEGQAAKLQTGQHRHEAGKERDASPWEHDRAVDHHNRYLVLAVVLGGKA
jgi:hypothetical protein